MSLRFLASHILMHRLSNAAVFLYVKILILGLVLHPGARGSQQQTQDQPFYTWRC